LLLKKTTIHFTFMKTIPNKNKKEWRDLVTGQLNVPLQNFFFQMKLTQTKNLLANDKISVEKAVEDMYNLCVKFSKAKNMDKDIEAIFGVEETTNSAEITEHTETSVNINGDLTTNTTSDLSAKKSTDRADSIREELERIKREAAKREAEFKRRRIEYQEKMAIETRAREKAARIAEAERKNRIIQEEKLKEQEAIQRRLAGEKIEREALKQASIRKKNMKPKKQSPKKRTFFQRFFHLS